MARAMWSGVVSFGMVTIPVKLHTATESHNVSFHLLHEKCDTRIKEQRWCPHCDEQVEWEDVVKGFEYSKGEYIELTPEDFEKLPLPSKHTIDVASFVDLDKINPIYYDSTYYISVDGAAQKPYKLLLDVMEKQHVAGIATITFRNKERLCALRPMEGKLTLQTLLYEDELRKNPASKPSAVKVSAQEKKMAETLINALTEKEFDPSKFKDKYQNALKKLIQAKLKGKELKEIKPNEPTNVTDLMEALRASLEGAKKGGKKTAAAAKSSPSAKTDSKSISTAKTAAKKSTRAKASSSKSTKSTAKKRSRKTGSGNRKTKAA